MNTLEISVIICWFLLVKTVKGSGEFTVSMGRGEKSVTERVLSQGGRKCIATQRTQGTGASDVSVWPPRRDPRGSSEHQYSGMVVLQVTEESIMLKN